MGRVSVCVCVFMQPFRERLSHKSPKAYASMPDGFIGNGVAWLSFSLLSRD